MPRQEKTASGHQAGIQSSSSFSEKEKALRLKRDRELKELNDKYNEEKPDTVYRDKRGRKLDMLNQFMRQQMSKEGKEKIIEEAQYEWGKGSVQKKELEDAKQELLDIANQPFARTIDDPKLEQMRKETLRDGDPMAQYIQEKKRKVTKVESSSKSGSADKKPSRPVYAGPTPPPNRFSIRPGYRWDAVDRGNGFEQKLLLKVNDRSSLKEDEYLWSVADL